ncbi:hypothetical protein SCLCIDRAFT_131775 [Scleroderma citrinum Foug A]|uniref:Yeast cell wall synthesis Kre9/Knh1-like N-terminal domain-containing protein n=1 Tax=Scleroderma citrinum Foug A TaxID=1036808 RepID=A0A0C3DL50_9AGAM|nr:hypothetical protein SCLCIDRAFT_131775 [Scleroderma citrinum Foug A]
MSFLAVVMPMPLHKRDVFVPPVVTPDANTVWVVGQYYDVTWDTSNPPAQITNTEGQIYLIVNGLIDFDYKLASGFNILDGSVQIQVPNVPTGTYAIVLFGDSGNDSQSFTITQ